MRYLFVFAHPDDETVACASTIKQLSDRGDEVRVVAVTTGAAGEVSSAAKQALRKHGSVAALRSQELSDAVAFLGASSQILDYHDGQITNQDVWGSLQQNISEIIDDFHPAIVITFDHTGWYYHLDHVGVSIATTLAFQSSVHRPQALLFSHYQPGGDRWKYIFRPAPATHQVVIQNPDHKLKAIEFHRSQNLSIPKKFVQTSEPKVELYELAFADARGKKLLSNHPIFLPISAG